MGLSWLKRRSVAVSLSSFGEYESGSAGSSDRSGKVIVEAMEWLICGDIGGSGLGLTLYAMKVLSSIPMPVTRAHYNLQNSCFMGIDLMPATRRVILRSNGSRISPALTRWIWRGSVNRESLTMRTDPETRKSN